MLEQAIQNHLSALREARVITGKPHVSTTSEGVIVIEAQVTPKFWNREDRLKLTQVFGALGEQEGVTIDLKLRPSDDF